LKLLFDQNLSHRLKGLLDDVFPESIHVKDIKREASSDTIIWEYAKREGYAIVSKDSDFHQRSFVLGQPPKVIWIQRGNCSTDEIYSIINKNEEAIRLFVENKKSSFLVLE
jgi:predicted nuclease of predicted toxin-antitoxin system